MIKSVLKLNVFLLLLVGISTPVLSQNKADKIIGVWQLGDKSSKMEIYKKANKYYGKLLYGKDIVNEDGSSKKDIHNPEPKLRNRNIVGITYIKNLVFDDGEYDKGKVYDSTTGKTWNCYVKMKDGNLLFTGYMGVKWLGKTYTYKRIK